MEDHTLAAHYFVYSFYALSPSRGLLSSFNSLALKFELRWSDKMPSTTHNSTVCCFFINTVSTDMALILSMHLPALGWHCWGLLFLHLFLFLSFFKICCWRKAKVFKHRVGVGRKQNLKAPQLSPQELMPPLTQLLFSPS